MSFFDDASLVFLPSGGAGKDGKAYSMKPTNGDGDFTFSRGSNLTATRVDSNGLIAKGRENLLLQSNQFDTTWTNNLGASGTIADNQSGYDGSNDAWLLTKDATTFARVQQTLDTPISGVWTMSAYLKAGTATLSRFRFNSASYMVEFNFSTGVATDEGSVSAIDFGMTDVGNGWYRCYATFNASVSIAQIYVDYNTSTSTTMFIQDAQLEQGLVATEYIESGATTGLAGILEDSPRFDYSGGASCPSLLLEPSRTNEIGYSEYLGSWFSSGGTLTANAATSPEGVQNAYSYTNSEFTTLRDSVTLSTSTQYTFSFYAKNVDATIARYRVYDDTNAADIISATSYFSQLSTNEWKRIEVTFTTSATGTQYGVYLQNANQSGKMLFYGAQLEEGSYATSYIPNHSGGSVTREADSSIVESLGYSSTCTFYYEFNTTTGREGSSPFAEVGKDNSNKFYIKGSSESNPQFQVQGNGIFSGSISPTNEVSGTNKIVVQWSSGVGVVFSNGVKQIGTLTNSNTSENIDFITMKGNGTFHDSKQLLFFEQALPDNQCIALTS